MEEKKKLSRVMVGKLEGKRSGTPINRYEDNIKEDFKELGWEGVNLIHLAQCRDQWGKGFLKHVMNLRIP
jgi:hypothetical protein